MILRRAIAPLAFGLGTLVALATCSRKLPLENRPCPCAAGYDCCNSRCLPKGSCPNDGGTAANDAPSADHTAPSPDQSLPSETARPAACPAPEPPCNPGLARCGSPDCTIFTETNHDNCGMCGRSCRDSECQGGECQPKTVTTYSTDLGTAIFGVNSTGIYWAIGDTIMGREFATGTDRTVATAPARIRHITVDEQYAYIMEEGINCHGWCIRRVGLGPGGVLEPPWVITDVESGGLSSDDAALYWTNASGSIMRLAKIAGPPMVRELATNQRAASGVVIDDQYAYWSNEEDSVVTIRRVRLEGNGAAPEDLIVGVGHLAAMAVDRDNIYWSEFPEGHIRMAPKRVGAQPTTIGGGAPSSILATGTAVYMISGFWNNMARFSPCDGQMHDGVPTVNPRDVAVMGDYVYFSEKGRLARFAR